MTTNHAAASRQMSSLRWGTIMIVFALIAGAALFNKQAILTKVTPGKTITVQFTADHYLRNYISEAKIAGIPVGVVTSVDKNDDGVTEVKVKVTDQDSLKAMGTKPSARVRPKTLLGGNYYVDIIPGGLRGEFRGTIPTSRTKLPVELGAVPAALPEGARKGIRSSISDLNATLDNDGSDSVRRLLSNAPDTLKPATGALTGLQGTHPKSDLRKLVDGLETTARVLATKNGQLDGIVTDLATTSRVLANRRIDLKVATAGMPETLEETTAMLRKLRGTLGELEDTAGPARDSVKELDSLLKNLGPVVKEARPVVATLRTVLTDANPTVKNLVPTARDLTGSLQDVQGPVIGRVNGPIMKTVMSPWHGTGQYAGGGADRPFFKELGYMFSNLAQANMVDRNGSMVSFLPGVGPGSLGGLPISLEQIFGALIEQAGGTQ